jgi:DNA-directed RNA polymerase sigma subunit (sigma70/sigma32)
MEALQSDTHCPNPSAFSPEHQLTQAEINDRWDDSDPVFSALSIDIYQRPVLTKPEEQQLFNEIQAAKTPTARQALILKFTEHNLRLVISRVKQFTPPTPFTRHDLFQIGAICTQEAVPTWDPQQSEFSTHATHRIDGGIRTFIKIVHPLFKRNVIEKIKRFERYEDALVQQQQSTQIPPEDTLDSMEVTSPKTRRTTAHAMYLSPDTLNRPAHDPGNIFTDIDYRSPDYLPSEPPYTPYQAEQNILAQYICDLLSSPSDDHELTALEQTALARYYGLNGHRPRLLKQLGAELGHKSLHQGASRIKQSALRKLKDNLPEDELTMLRDFYDAS